MQAGRWKGWSPTSHLGGQLGGGRQLGILGMGRIGQAVARRANVWHEGCITTTATACAPRSRPIWTTWWDESRPDAGAVDIVSVNAPHTPRRFHLLNARRLKLMKPSAVVINTSRGEVIDARPDAHFAHRRIAGAGLDVFEHGHGSTRACGFCPMWCCCRIWARPRVEGASRWVKRSSTISAFSPTACRRRIWSLPSML